MSRFSVKKVAVLGAGVMGAQIAAHLVNLRVPVLLFDLPAPEGPKSGIAIKAIEGMDDPHGIGDDFLLCVEQMIDASERGYTWRVSDAAAFENALRAAVDILQGVSPVEMLDATVWVNQCGSVLA